jgi:hypothetical protein
VASAVARPSQPWRTAGAVRAASGWRPHSAVDAQGCATGTATTDPADERQWRLERIDGRPGTRGCDD